MILSDRILGAHLLGPHADDVINLFATAIRFDLKTSEIKDIPYAYPAHTYDIGYIRRLYMARLDRMQEPMRSHLANLPCPSFENHPWAPGAALSQRRVSIISTAGLHRRGDRPFEGMAGDYRVIPGDIMAKDLVMTHISTNFDRTGFQRDWNVAFPLDRLRELAGEGIIMSTAYIFRQESAGSAWSGALPMP